MIFIKSTAHCVCICLIRFFHFCLKQLYLLETIVCTNLMLSEPYSSDLTSNILGVWSSTVQGAKWWRTTWSTSPASFVASPFLAAVRHHRSWSLLRELMHTIPLFALLMALTLQCHSSAQCFDALGQWLVPYHVHRPTFFFSFFF